jgi:DNA replication and repair protein RecF
MHLRELELDEFRSFRSLRLDVDVAGFRAVGPNASGKSTLLEAIAMLATTRSPQTSAEREIPNWASGSDLGVPPFARVRGVFSREDGVHSLELGLTFDERSARSKKLVRLDERGVRAVDAVGQLKSVLFAPRDVDLLAGAPAVRRRFLDVAIGQASRPYLRALARYGRVLEQRNSLLRTLARERGASDRLRVAHELGFWDGELVTAGTEVLAHRIGTVTMLSASAREHFAVLSGVATLEMAYSSHRSLVPEGIAVDSWRDPGQEPRQAIAAAFAASISSARDEELRRGVTAIGPHRDDFVVFADGVDLGRFGSRGQQRLAVVALKLAELDLLEASAGEPPVLLLDDVLSELDKMHRGLVVSSLAPRRAQVCVTATDVNDLATGELDHLPLLRVIRGTVEPWSAASTPSA